MIRIVVILYLVSLYLSIPPLIKKAGIRFYLGLIPIVNLYYLFKVLKINPILLIVFSILMILFPFRELFLTMFIIFLPFMISDAYEDKLLYSILGLVIPFIIYPYIGYFHGAYRYGGEDIELY